MTESETLGPTLSRSFPRLSRSNASAEILNWPAGSEEPQKLLPSTSIEGAVYYALTDHRVDSSELEAIRVRILEVAADSGFPDRPSPAQQKSFDRSLVAALPSIIQMSPAEATEEEVWSFLTVRVLPDVAAWRWPRDRDRETYERYLGTPRNIFRRAWWTNHCLGEYGPQLGAESLVQIIERTSIGFSPKLARAVAKVFLEQEATNEQELLREAMKLILRLGGRISLLTMPTELVEEKFQEVFVAAARSLKS
jgi:hypothetical protein